MNFGQPYYNNYGGYNNMYQPTYRQPNIQQMQQIPMQMQQNYLQGKMVDSIDVVRATDVPFDGSTTFFPLTDGSKIITKTIALDGTTRIVEYKPVVETENVESKNIPSILTIDDLNTCMQKYDNSSILVELKNQIEELKKSLVNSQTEKIDKIKK